MIRLADAIAPHLDRCGVQFHIAPPNVPIDDRPDLSNEMNADYYLALHSNAGGNGNAWGPIAFYHTSGKVLAERLAKELLATGQKSNRASNVTRNTTLFELRCPVAPAVLLEVDFHDSPEGVAFITQRRSEIAEAIARCIIEADGKTFAPVTTGEYVDEAVRLGLFPKGTQWNSPLTKEDAAVLAVKLKALLERG